MSVDFDLLIVYIFVFFLLQRSNPILKFVRSVPWEFGDVVPDYVLGQTTCALFLRWVALGSYEVSNVFPHKDFS